ncbi:MAG TPA: 4Fe-4S dicluster domain-containing protein [Tepidisphaeraceae bacterium]|nr:4Fe-4S dicluster domain-containing protein [Tepidisphaeraceae bacterium]
MTDSNLWPVVVPQFTPLAPSAAEPKPTDLPTGSDLTLWLSALASAGLQADRANCPDLFAQLRASADETVESVIITALDSDPALRFHAAVAATWPDQLIAGARFIARISGATQVYLAIERNAPPPWTQTLRRAAFDHSVRLVELPNDYPQADPTLIVYTLTGRRLPPRRLPPDKRCIVADAPAAAAIGRWIGDKENPSWTPCAILDHKTGKSAFLKIPLAASIGDLVESAGFHRERNAPLLGDLLRDRRAAWTDPIGHGELVVHLIQRDANPLPAPCIRCGWCVDLCPTGVHPARLLDAIQRHDPRMARRAGDTSCIECGICAYACPSNLPLLDAFRRHGV